MRALVSHIVAAGSGALLLSYFLAGDIGLFLLAVVSGGISGGIYSGSSEHGS